MNQVEEILSQLRDGDKLIYNIAAKVIEELQKRVEELEKQLVSAQKTVRHFEKVQEICFKDQDKLEKENTELKAKLKEVDEKLPSDKLIEERAKEFESETYYDVGGYVGDFEIGAKWVVDYIKGKQR